MAGGEDRRGHRAARNRRFRPLRRPTGTGACGGRDAKLPYKVLDDNVETTSGKASISTMHLPPRAWNFGLSW
jgi:hypothetical protein